MSETDAGAGRLGVELEYEAVEKAPRRMELAVEGRRFVLVFALTPRWVTMVGIVVPFAWGLLNFAAASSVAWMLWSMSRSVGMVARLAWVPVLAFLTGGIFLLLSSWWHWRSYRGYGHLSRRLYLDETKGTLGQRKEGSARWREWPLCVVTSARLMRVRNLLGRPAGAALRIRLRGWPYVVGAPCGEKDVAALRRFVEEMARVMPGKVTVAQEILGAN